MHSIQQFTRTGFHNETAYDIEVWVFETGEVMLQAVHIDGLPPRKLADGHRPVATLEEAFELGAEIARGLIDAT